jgi:hypothetical protein
MNVHELALGCQLLLVLMNAVCMSGARQFCL